MGVILLSLDQASGRVAPASAVQALLCLIVGTVLQRVGLVGGGPTKRAGVIA